MVVIEEGSSTILQVGNLEATVAVGDFEYCSKTLNLCMGVLWLYTQQLSHFLDVVLAGQTLLRMHLVCRISLIESPKGLKKTALDEDIDSLEIGKTNTPFGGQQRVRCLCIFGRTLTVGIDHRDWQTELLGVFRIRRLDIRSLLFLGSWFFQIFFIPSSSLRSNVSWFFCRLFRIFRNLRNVLISKTKQRIVAEIRSNIEIQWTSRDHKPSIQALCVQSVTVQLPDPYSDKWYLYTPLFPIPQSNKRYPNTIH